MKKYRKKIKKYVLFEKKKGVEIEDEQALAFIY